MLVILEPEEVVPKSSYIKSISIYDLYIDISCFLKWSLTYEISLIGLLIRSLFVFHVSDWFYLRLYNASGYIYIEYISLFKIDVCIIYSSDHVIYHLTACVYTVYKIGLNLFFFSLIKGNVCSKHHIPKKH